MIVSDILDFKLTITNHFIHKKFEFYLNKNSSVSFYKVKTIRYYKYSTQVSLAGLSIRGSYKQYDVDFNKVKVDSK